MSTINCSHGKSAPSEVIERLHKSQAQTGRHKCAICAYIEGFKKGFSSRYYNCPIPIAHEISFEHLPDSQAGEERHKCCACAYFYGYEDGKRQRLG